MLEPGYSASTDPIPRSLNALALLASGDPAYQSLVQREAKWAAGFATDDFRTWYYGYVMIFLAEYTNATNDNSFLPGLKRLAKEAASGQSAVGSWGTPLLCLMAGFVAMDDEFTGITSHDRNGSREGRWS